MKDTKRYRWLAVVLIAFVLLLFRLWAPSFAEDRVQLVRRFNIILDQKFTVFGKSHYSLGYYQEGLEADAQPVFCLEPGRPMPNGTAASYKRYEARAGESVPGVGSSQKFVPITLAYEWMQHEGNMRDPIRYAVVQIYIWGCMSGYEQDWAAQEKAQQAMTGLLGPEIMTEFEDMKEFVQQGVADFSDSGNAALPSWNNTSQQMTVANGRYELTLEIGSCPQLKETSWELPDANWSYEIQGDSITFYYQGAEKPSGEIRSGEIPGVESGSIYYAYIFTPGNDGSMQAQLGRFANEEAWARVSFTVGEGVHLEGQPSEFQVFRHSETFQSHYTIDLEKYCAETNQTLEGSVFNVWESFDRSQVSGKNYAEGQPDGSSGRLYANRMDPMPEAHYLCTTITTDENGWASHRDQRAYDYSKTYCMGHPAPEWVEVPEEEYDEETGECTNEGEIEAAEAENERLRQIWQAQQELCEETCDFHVGNEDEDNHQEDESAREEMLADRDETYDRFIHLKYTYDLEEKTARTGYIRHGLHNDDLPVQPVTLVSAQAGSGRGRAAGQSAAESSSEDQALRRATAAEGISLTKFGPRQATASEGAVLRAGKTLHFPMPFISQNLEMLRRIEWGEMTEERRGTEAEARKRTATGTEAEYDDDETEEDDDEGESLEGALTEPELYRYVWEGLGRLNAATFSEDEELEDELEIDVDFPDFTDDDLEEADTSGQGDLSKPGHIFQVYDHRTEGEVYFNKRDLELYQAQGEDSYGKSQGDATLEGAVYGLFAAENLIHPDGKSGAIYHQDDLTAIGTTDEQGNASFLAFTEAPGTRIQADGNVQAPDGGEDSFWIGRPLLLGSYYIRELSRSEGYELSVYGKNQSETNRAARKEELVIQAGEVRVAEGLSDGNHMDSDGSWNDFVVEYYGTEQGYQIVVSGYPQGSTFYRMETEEAEREIEAITGSSLEPKLDEAGNPVYCQAKGGELKTDSQGNPVVSQTEVSDRPQAEAFSYRFRMGGRLNGWAEPEDEETWQQELTDGAYLAEEVNQMLEAGGILPASPEMGSPWTVLELEGDTYAQAGTEILDWYTQNNVWDSGWVASVTEAEGRWSALLYYDYSRADEACPGFYDSAGQKLYLRKPMTVFGQDQGHYWLTYEKGSYSLGTQTAVVFQKKEIPESCTVTVGDSLKELVQPVYQPAYETYEPGELLLDSQGQPIPALERVYSYTTVSQKVTEEKQIPLEAVYDKETGNYTIDVENAQNWQEETEKQRTRYRAVTPEKTISVQGQEMFYSHYLTEQKGAGVWVSAATSEFEPGSYLESVLLVYPGQNIVTQDGGTGAKPVQVLERVIRQPVKITKDISLSSYEENNTYGSVHNDPLTAFLGLFQGSSQRQKALSRFKFRIYLKSSLEQAADPQTGERLLEEKPEGGWNYQKFMDAMALADEGQSGTYPQASLEQFAARYFSLEPDENAFSSQQAQVQAMERAKEQAAAYADRFAGLNKQLAVAWDGDSGGGVDKDLTTLECRYAEGTDHYYNVSIPLPYGTYVIAEQEVGDQPEELANRHFDRQPPREVVIPFAPDLAQGQAAGHANPFFRYNPEDDPRELIAKYSIRFNEENHEILAHHHEGDFKIYKYTSSPHQCERAGLADGVFYGPEETQNGEAQLRDQVPTMQGKQTAFSGKYAAMLVPWSILEPVTDRVNPDTGSVETRKPSGQGADFNYVSWAQEDFENRYDSAYLRIEKLDGETGDNIIHDGALFKLYAGKRQVIKDENGEITGSGKALYGPAVDAEGKPVLDLAGNPILYPRVGRSNSSDDDLPIRLDQDGLPLYDESQLIRQVDQLGNEVGIFQAFSTEQEIVIDGVVQKKQTGYIRLPRPLGAGVYVLVEIQPPAGYARSRPAAVEIYGNGDTYYEEQRPGDGTTEGWKPVETIRYQYAIVNGQSGGEARYEQVSQVKVKNAPSRVDLYKVEDGDSLVGNENGLSLSGKDGQTEASGGFEEHLLVNDRGDELLYPVSGRKEYLEGRKDVKEISFNRETGVWQGYAVKSLEQWSEQIIEGTELELRSQPGVKPLYRLDGSFTGKGICFQIPVNQARLALYQGLELKRTGLNQYEGVTVTREKERVTAIEAAQTGSHLEIQNPDSNQWQETPVPNQPVRLFFYDLEKVSTEQGETEGELYVLDQRGNRICRADAESGMAYVYDDMGRLIAYRADESGEKQLVQSIQVLKSGDEETIYSGQQAQTDENGLPVYYTAGQVILREESWVSGASQGPAGEEETQAHRIARLPFGAYILQEEQAPLEQGYIQAPYLGLILEEGEEIQKFFLQNEYTKTAFDKIDVRTALGIKGAGLTLYQAALDEEGNPIVNEDGEYEKGPVYETWISGGTPHWIDHIPPGAYVLEETLCPYDQGYVQSKGQSIHVLETGSVQSFAMEDDFTAVEIEKLDSFNQDPLYEDSPAWLSLYRCRTDDQGKPLTDDEGQPLYREEDRIFTFRAAGCEDGKQVAATAHEETDAAGLNPIVKYDYSVLPIPNTIQGRYYYTENGRTRLEYLPVGSYVLTEERTPEGYATAAPLLLTVKDVGHLQEIQQYTMEDQPLTLEVSKTAITGGPEVAGAHLAIYPLDDQGNPAPEPLLIHRPGEDGQYIDQRAEWISGSDGKPHVISYIPAGKYVLVEEMTPYGFLQSVQVPFTIEDTGEIQQVEMIDQIPEGILKLVKGDEDRPEKKLAGARFALVNLTLGVECQQLVTDENGQGTFAPEPIGYLGENGSFEPYTYVCREIQAAPGYMLTLKPWEFQFTYADEKTPVIPLEWNPLNQSNRVKVEKRNGQGDWLEGAVLQIERLDDPQTPEQENQVIERWTSGRQAHYVKDLQPGRYRLTELQTPGQGYELLAEPVEFSIEADMEEVPCFVMVNYALGVEIQKTIGKTDHLLAGASLQLICQEDGTVVEQWTSQDTAGHRIYGLKPGRYVIRELKAPDGYRKSEDLVIELSGGKDEIQVIQYANYKKSSSSGSGGSSSPDQIVFKKTDLGGKPLAGAVFGIYDSQGELIEKAVSDAVGVIRVTKPDEGTYTMRELQAPDGYLLNTQSCSFSVKNASISRNVYEIANRPLEVILKKTDGQTGQGLPGARLEIRESGSGQAVFTGVTDEQGKLIYQAEKPGTYEIRELEAPEGYVKTDQVSTFAIQTDGTVSGTVTVLNYAEQVSIGRITAHYPTRSLGGGHAGGHSPQTGDFRPLWIPALLLVLSVVGLLFQGIFSGRKNKKIGLGLLLLLVLLAVPSVKAEARELTCVRTVGFPARTQEDQKEAESSFEKTIEFQGKKLRLKEISTHQLSQYVSETGGRVKAICSEAFLDSAENHRPDRVLKEGEITYLLESWETIPALLEGRSMLVGRQVVYPQMEGGYESPSVLKIQAEDPITGADFTVTAPLKETKILEEEWKQDFSLSLPVEGNQAQVLQLGDRGIPMGEVPGDPETGPELLREAGLNPDLYQVTEVRWRQGDPESGVLELSGNRLVQTIQAAYETEAMLEPLEGQAIQAVYTEWQGGLKDGEIVGRMETTATYEGTSWDGVKLPVGFFPGLLAVLGTAAVLLLLWHFRDRVVICGKARWLTFLFLFVGVVSALVLGQTFLEDSKGRREYEAIRSLKQEQETEDQDKKKTQIPDWEKQMKEINEDYFCWLEIPGTEISYPVVWEKETGRYLKQSFTGEERACGAIFSQGLLAPFQSQNTVFYGHNMKDGSMFGQLKKYEKEEFYRAHPVLQISRGGRTWQCPILGCQIRKETDQSLLQEHFTQEQWQQYCEGLLQTGLYETEAGVSGLKEDEKVLTLSTCYGKEYRLLVQAVVKEEIL